MTEQEVIELTATIEYEGEVYHQVGCRKCGGGDNLKLYHNGKKPVVRCGCGHVIELDKAPGREPDPKPLDMRFFT